MPATLINFIEIGLPCLWSGRSELQFPVVLATSGRLPSSIHSLASYLFLFWTRIFSILINLCLCFFARFPWEELRRKCRRLSRPFVPTWRHMYRRCESFSLPMSAHLHGRTMRTGYRWVLITTERLPERRYLHQHDWRLLVYLRERLDW